MVASLQRAGLDPRAPTLVLAECVLVYLEPQHSAALVAALGQLLSTAALVIYEQVQLPWGSEGRFSTAATVIHRGKRGVA